MTRENIFAWTDTADATCPQYISVNREEDGRVSVSVRGPPRQVGSILHPGYTGEMTLPDDKVLADLVFALHEYLALKALERTG